MTPEPMSYADIEAIRDEFSTLTGDYFKSNSPEFAEYTRAIIAARDAQWREMLGEPVAWIDTGDLRLMHSDGRGCIAWPQQYPNTTTPLYAIKDKP